MADHMSSPQRLQDTVHVYRRQDELFDWRLKDAEGRVLATSGGQGYEHAQDALDMAWDLFPNTPASQFVMEGN